MMDTSTPHHMESVLNDLRQIIVNPALENSTKTLLLSVLELRAGNWGKGPPSPKNESEDGGNDSSEVNTGRQIPVVSLPNKF